MVLSTPSSILSVSQARLACYDPLSCVHCFRDARRLSDTFIAFILFSFYCISPCLQCEDICIYHLLCNKANTARGSLLNSNMVLTTLINAFLEYSSDDFKNEDDLKNGVMCTFFYMR